LILILSNLGWTLQGGPAAANPIPDPALSEVLPADIMGGVVLAPGHPTPITACRQTVTVRDPYNNPWPDAYVEIVLASGLATCPDAVLSGLTDAQGRIALDLVGGGCLQEGASCVVRALGVPLRQFAMAKSPDRDGNLVVNLIDLLDFASAYQLQSTGCHDYDNAGGTGLSDLLIFASAYSPQHSCP